MTTISSDRILRTSDGSCNLVLCAPNSSRRPSNTNRLYTLGLFYLRAAAERAGWSVRLLDAYFSNLSHDETLFALQQGAAPTVVGFTLNSSEMYDEANKLLRTLRATVWKHPVLAIAGGFYASREVDHLLRDTSEFDAVVRGDGEDALQAILNAASQGRLPEASASIMVRDPASIDRQVGRLQGPSDLDKLGIFDFDWFDSQPGPDEWSLVTSRGCSAACSFCIIGPHWGRYREWRGHSAEWVHGQMHAIVARGARYIQFVDDQFIGNKVSVQRAERLITLLNGDPTGVPFYILARADTVLDNADLFRRLATVGLDTVFLGLESGDNVTLSRFNKEHSAEQGAKAVRVLDQAGIKTVAGTIVFYPWMTEATIRAEIQFLRRALVENDLFYFYDLNELDVLSNTPLAVHYGLTKRGLHPWQPEDRQMRKVRDVWRIAQDRTIFPAMASLPLFRNLSLRQALCKWMLDWLEKVTDAAVNEKPIMTVLADLHLAMVEFILAYGGPDKLAQFLIPVQSANVFEAEHCFD